MATGAEKRAAKRAAKKAAYKNPKVADKEASWCLKHGWYILLAVNVTFAVCIADVSGFCVAQQPLDF